MTHLQFRRAVNKLGLTVVEASASSDISIVVEAPRGQRFRWGVHTLSIRWHNDHSAGRELALAYAKKSLPLQSCPADCKCLEES